MTCKAAEQRLKAIKDRWGDKKFVRGIIAADGSWLRRSYSNAARSPCGQAMIIGSLTRSVIAWGFRVMKCSRENIEHCCAVNHYGTVKAMESQIIVECVETLLEKGFVPAEIALDGDATTYSSLLRKFVDDPAVRHFGGEMLIDMKADDRHMLTTMKDHFFPINKQHTVVVKGKPRITPLSEPHECYYLSKLVNLIKSQLRSDKQLSETERFLRFQKQVGNILCHYFNDQPGSHLSCEQVGYNSCQVVQFRLTTALVWVLKRDPWKELTQRWCGDSLKLVGEFLGLTQEIPNGKHFPVFGTVKTKLQDNKWLGDRCLDVEHKLAFRTSMAAEFSSFCETKMAKKILRENDTQVNESGHSVQTRMNRKDINQGRCTEYPAAMAAGVLKVSLGQSYMPKLANKLGCRIPQRALTYFDRRHAKLTNQAAYKRSKHGKLVRKNQRQLFNKVIKQQSSDPKGQQDDYRGKGGGLFEKDHCEENACTVQDAVISKPTNKARKLPTHENKEHPRKQARK